MPIVKDLDPSSSNIVLDVLKILSGDEKIVRLVAQTHLQLFSLNF